jgi:CheY-like chemotaxis protein
MARRTVLIVEDEPEIRKLAVESLREAGHDVLEAASGREAILLLEAHPEIDLVFTDIVMPGIDGFKVADMAKFIRPAVKILYATGYARQVLDYLGVVHGRILRKPYRQAELTDAITGALTCHAGRPG